MVTKKFTELKEKSHFKYFDEIVFASEQLKYFTAHLFLLRPFIDSPLPAEVNGQILYYFYQNPAGKRYNMYSDICFQKTYNYWDRIGDFLTMLLKEKKSRKIYFSNVLNDVNEEYKLNEHFNWLWDFNQKEYKSLNEKRIEIVQYFSLNTQFREGHLQNVRNKDFIEKLQFEREALPQFFKTNTQLAALGFYHTLKLVELLDKN